MNNPRLESVDVARGFAALSVAVYHHGFGKALAAVTGWHYFEWIGWPGAAFAVPLFFVISGFCIHLGSLALPAAGTGQTSRFYLFRLVRIYPAWIIAVLFSAAVLWAGGTVPTARQLITHVTLTNGFVDDYGLNSALWSVSVECCLYLLYPFWLWVRHRFGLAAAILLSALGSIVSCRVTAHYFPIPCGPSLWFFLNVWIGWVAGAILAEIWSTPKRSWLRRPVWWLGGACALGLHLGLGLNHVYDGAWFYLRLPITICLWIWPLAGLLLAGEKVMHRSTPAVVSRLWQGMATIGLFSYSLYLLHIPLQSLRFVLLPKLSATPILGGPIFLAWFGLILAISWLSYRWVEVPASRLGRRLIERCTPSQSSTPLLAKT